jgi:nucleoside 2-deoxyribosyltransferase
MGVVPILMTKMEMGFAITKQMPEINARTDKATKTGMANAVGQGIVAESKVEKKPVMKARTENKEKTGIRG